MLRLRVKAPFAAFRRFVAGSYRPTAPLPTPTAVYGLLLNIAAIESRRDDGTSPMTVTALGLPPCDLALGLVSTPEVQVLFQQLHNYPVGSSGQERAAETFGGKYNIQPVHRELLSGLDMCVCVRGNDALEASIREGLQRGTAFSPEGRRRYGVPFLGDNNFLLSHLFEEQDGQSAYWLSEVGPGGESETRSATRLPIWIDRADMTRTEARVFSQVTSATVFPPEDAWVHIRPP